MIDFLKILMRGKLKNIYFQIIIKCQIKYFQ